MSDNFHFNTGICKEYGIPMPIIDKVRFDYRRRWRFDFAWPGYFVAVEVNGGIWRKGGGAHQGSGHIRDMEKINMAIELGWVVLQYEPGKVAYTQVKRVLTNKYLDMQRRK